MRQLRHYAILKTTLEDRNANERAGESSQMAIEKLKLKNVGPFDDIEFEFDPQVNVFTGPNNSGKSSALWALGDIATYPFTFPERLLRDGKPAEFSVHASDGEGIMNGRLPCGRVSNWPSGDPGFQDFNRSREFAIFLMNVGYSRFIPALRHGTDFRSDGPAPTLMPISEGDTATHEVETLSEDIQILIAARDGLRDRIKLTPTDASITYDMAVIQRIINLHYRSFMKRDSAFSDIVDEVANMASSITEGFPLSFAGVNEDDKGFFPQFGTVDGHMPLNTLSQGTQSIIQWLAHLLIGYAEYYDFPESLSDKPGILIIDEIDAHLHPSWQRRIIPTLTERFPKLQIFCSTHSPLMLAGLKAGQVQLLRRDEDGRVTVSRNERDLAGWTADEILRHFLDVRAPSDLGSANRLKRLTELRMKTDLSDEEAEEMEDLRYSVRDDLLKGPAQAQIERFAEMMKRHWAESAARKDKSPTGAGQ